MCYKSNFPQVKQNLYFKIYLKYINSLFLLDLLNFGIFVKIIYNIAIKLYYLLTGIVGLFNPKAKLFHQGQKGLLKRIEESVKGSGSQIIWVHCSSVGEFEQARPIIEWYKREKPEYKILLTFFSPSGYQLRKNYPLADWVFYMPVDTTSNARKFIGIVKPVKAIFIKYEFWYNYLIELKRNNVETYIVAAIFRPTQHFFKWYGGFFRRMLSCYTRFFVQDRNSAELLAGIGVTENVMICGDTRFDRVHKITESSKGFPVIESFSQNGFTIVAGSSWGPDEELLAGVLKNFPRTRVVIAPHEIGTERIASVENTFVSNGFKVVKFSQFGELCGGVKGCDGESVLPQEAVQSLKEANVLIIDCIGILSSLYKYGKVAYIGGGFGVGIHNILEAATYGCPVLFGPNYKKFKEAVDLVGLGGAVSVRNQGELYTIVKTFVNVAKVLDEKGSLCTAYVKSNLGATEKIVSVIERK